MGGYGMEMSKYFLCFAFFSFVGWLWECIYYTIQQRRRVNSGFLTTCFCPIYGIGGLLGLVLLGRVQNTVVLFFAGIIVTGTLEYFVGWLLEKLFNRRWWDYTGWPLNINGRICIISVVAFGLATVALVKYIGPATISFINTLDPVMVQASSMVIALVMLIDTVYSVRHMNTDKLWFVEKQEEFIENNRIMNRIRETFKR